MKGSCPAAEFKEDIRFILRIICMQKKAVAHNQKWIFSMSVCAVTARTMTLPDTSQRGVYQTSMRWICNPPPCLA